jgi:hypothetical protein
LDAIRGAVAKVLGRHDDFLAQRWEVTLTIHCRAMSALPPKADIRQRYCDVCFVP